jgi:hypothetical protein
MATIPDESEVLGWFQSLSNWGRWGERDERGTLNLITDEKRQRAAALVREGRALSCGWEIDPRPTADQTFGPPQRFMLSTGQGLRDPGDRPRWAGAAEYLGLVFHGYSVTHLDALSHYFFDGRMYNGLPAERVTSARGATAHAVTAIGEGIATRGILVDVAAARGVEWLEPGEGVFPEDLDRALARKRVEVEPGDALLLRTGYGRRKRERGPDRTAEVARAGTPPASPGCARATWR